jgi:ATP-dependent clp protease, ATP-binding subunit clpX
MHNKNTTTNNNNQQTTQSPPNQHIHCNICGKEYTPKERFISVHNDSGADDLLLCQDCISELAVKIDLLDDKDEEKEHEEKVKQLPHLYKKTSPQKIRAYLDKFIIGQDEAKRILSVAYYNHLKRISLPEKLRGSIKKSNILLAGPTGSGKTLIAKKLAELANIPFVSADATSFTKSGYVGKDVDSIVQQLLCEAEYDVELAQRGIVYIDECDKLATSATAGDFIGGSAVQQALLKLMEGSLVPIVRANQFAIIDDEDGSFFDTSNILFIVGGAFSGIENIYKKRVNTTGAIGFGAQTQTKTDVPDDMWKNLQVEDFVKYGFIPEFIGRLPVIACLEKLTEKDLVNVLSEPKDSICKEYQQLFKMDGIGLSFAPEALMEVAGEAYKKNVGARGLRSVLEQHLTTLTYNINSNRKIKSVVLTKEYIKTHKDDDLHIEYKTKKQRKAKKNAEI